MDNQPEQSGNMEIGNTVLEKNNNGNNNKMEFRRPQYEEIDVPRPKTLTFSGENVGTDVLLQFLNLQNVVDKIECIQKLNFENSVNFEITCKTVEETRELGNKFNGKICINNVVLTLVENRPLKDIRKIPVIQVSIFEAPYELNDNLIIQQLSKYGVLHEQVVTHHKYRNTEINSEVRSVLFKSITKPIPTTIYIQGNKIKLKHKDQDRSPICSICKERGHYKDKCEKEKERKEEDEKRLLNAERSWAEIVDENDRKNKEDGSTTEEGTDMEEEDNPQWNKGNKTWTDVVEKGKTNNTNKENTLKEDFQKEMQRRRRQKEEENKKYELTQRLAEIEQFNSQNVKTKVITRGQKRSSLKGDEEEWKKSENETKKERKARLKAVKMKHTGDKDNMIIDINEDIAPPVYCSSEGSTSK